MEELHSKSQAVLSLCLAAFLVVAVAGCGAREPSFVSNEVYFARQEFVLGQEIGEGRKTQIQLVLESLFGTPAVPQTAALGEVDVTKVLDKVKLAAAAGAVKPDNTGKSQGLYREHCAHCHGITGDGMGPTAPFLNPYPRDYRMGVFKFKSTPKGFKPTHDDLKRILVQGIPGTAMPSFKLLTEDELESLIHYVRYLSIRGELERNLIQYCASELDENEALIDPSNKTSKPAKYEEELENIRSLASEVVDKWIQSETAATPVPARKEGWRDVNAHAASVKKGRDLFYGVVANCIKCHGDSALGDGTTNDYDDWTKELEPANSERLAAYIELGAPVARNIRPRNLRSGIYRGGRRPLDLYWRIRNGIDGTPMPGVLMRPADAQPGAKGLTEDDIWCLIDYVRSLPFESISRPPETAASVHRERL